MIHKLGQHFEKLLDKWFGEPVPTRETKEWAAKNDAEVAEVKAPAELLMNR